MELSCSHTLRLMINKHSTTHTYSLTQVHFIIFWLGRCLLLKKGRLYYKPQKVLIEQSTVGLKVCFMTSKHTFPFDLTHTKLKKKKHQDAYSVPAYTIAQITELYSMLEQKTAFKLI